MTNKRTQAVFYLTGGIGFIIAALILYFSSPQHDSLSLVLMAGLIIGGLMAIYSFFGLRREANADATPPPTPPTTRRR
jgi:uncharacterized membrane protein